MQAFDDGNVLGKELTILDELESQFMHRLQQFHVVAADLAGHVTGSTKQAIESNVDEPIRILARALEERQGSSESATCRVRLELIILDAGASFGEPPALHLVERNPLAICAAVAP